MSRLVSRRQTLTAVGAATFYAIAGRGAAQPALPKPPNLGEAEVAYAFAADTGSDKFDVSYNRRTQLKPALRAFCKTPNAVATMVRWARDKSLPFAVRSGGHSFEGLSQSASLVIDTRPLDAVVVDPRAQTATVGAGASLGNVYREVSKYGLAFSAGSCPAVGVAGHVLGGGYGFFSRAHGLAADNMQALSLVTADTNLRTADATREPDLYWASRGGGGGTFGIAIGFRFRLHRVPRISTYSIGWDLAFDQAAALLDAWQIWAVAAPDGITTLVKLTKAKSGNFRIVFSGTALMSAADAERVVFKALAAQPQPNVRRDFRDTLFFGAVDRFAGGWGYESKYSKGKSDFLIGPLAREAIATVLTELTNRPPNAIIVMFDVYGGAISRVAASDTAFIHRAKNALCIQYYTSWQRPDATERYVQEIDALYAAMRPFMPGMAYVNYCDLGLSDWQRAYWGDNARRLAAIKRKYDPQDIFRHAQSVKPA
jgi:FAD/FMN-containing dehydrogenase